jgi:hypothetical protein
MGSSYAISGGSADYFGRTRCMRRIVRHNKIIFVDRNLSWSLMLLASSLVALGLHAITRERHWDPTSQPLGVFAIIGSGALFLAALWLLFRKRAFVVDQNSRQLILVDRRFLVANTFSCPLEDVTVTMEQKRLQNTSRGLGTYELWVSCIWLNIRGRGNVPFLDDIRGSDAHTLAKRLAADLGRPLDVIQRSDW